jgi:hypothetical protein
LQAMCLFAVVVRRPPLSFSQTAPLLVVLHRRCQVFSMSCVSSAKRTSPFLFLSCSVQGFS